MAELLWWSGVRCFNMLSWVLSRFSNSLNMVMRNRAVNTNKDFITGTESQWDGCPEGARQKELPEYLFDRISTKRQSWDAVNERGTERETDYHTFQWKCISDFPWLLFYRHFADEASILSVALHLFLSAQMSAVMVEQNAEIQTCPKTGENGWHNMV